MKQLCMTLLLGICATTLLAQQADSTAVGQDRSTPVKGFSEGHEWVDLGLSIKWATCNIGAETPEEPGSFFAWGETATKKKFTWKNYKYTLDGDDVRSARFTKYNTQHGRGKIDNAGQLSPEDDAARMNWGKTWRMPSLAEWQELWNNCTAELVKQAGLTGYRLTSKLNGQSIFLPLAGIEGMDTEQQRAIGSYWSCMLILEEPSGAQNATFNSTGVRWNLNSARMYGRSIRPVLDEKKE